MTRQQQSDLWDRYVDMSTTYAEIAAMSVDDLVEQITDLGCNDEELSAEIIAGELVAYAKGEIVDE